MGENIRIIFENHFDTSVLEDQDNAATYKEHQTGEYLMNAEMTKSPMRHNILATKPAHVYTLRGRMVNRETLSCLAFVRPIINPEASLVFTMWNHDSDGSYTDPWDYRLRIEKVGIMPGWGQFNWEDYWGGNLAGVTRYNPMASVQAMWFDSPLYILEKYNTSTGGIDLMTGTGKTFVDNVKYWQLELDTSDIGPDTHSIDRIFMGAHLPLDYTISHGHSLLFQDKGKSYRTDGGSLITTLKPRFKELSFSFSVVSPSNRQKIAALLAHIGVHRDILVSLYPLNNQNSLELDYSIVGKLTKVPVMSEIIGGYYKTAMKIEET